MAKMKTKEFRLPLLTALDALSNHTASVPVPFRSTYGPVCQSLGITLGQFGQDARGKQWVATWILGAFRKLKEMGHAVQLGRGKWGITEEGIKEIRGQSGLFLLTTPEDDDRNPAPKESDTAPPPTEGVSLQVGPGHDDTGYHKDPYIRALAASQTKCFGYFSGKSKRCKECPLRGSCRNAMAARFSYLTGVLANQDAENARKAKEDTKPPKPNTDHPLTPDSDTSKTPVGGWDNTGAQVIISYTESVCYRCGKPIKKDEECYWLKGKGGPDGGLFHTACK